MSEHPSTVNMLKVPKNLWNLHESTFIIFFHNSAEKLFAKYLPDLSLKSKGYFLTYGLPIRSILFRIVRICRSWFKCNYLKNKKHFLSVFFHLWNLHQISNILKKKKNVIAYVFPKLTTDSELIRPFTKNHRVRTSFDSQHVKVFQILLKSPWEHFYHIFRSIWGKMIWKISSLLKFQNVGVFANT